jgi:hypothetical protein
MLAPGLSVSAGGWGFGAGGQFGETGSSSAGLRCVELRVAMRELSTRRASTDALIAFVPALAVCALHLGLAIVSGVMMPVIMTGFFGLYLIYAGVIYLLLSLKLAPVVRWGLIGLYGLGLGWQAINLCGDILQALRAAP